jgi:OFA family oxalate/formate antiporter-like MFS transporter
LGINLLLGVLYAWSPIAKELQKQYAWDDLDRNLPFAVSTAAFAVTMIFAGRIQDRMGPRWIAMIGGLVLGLGLIATAFTTSPYVMIFTYGVIGGVGIGLGYAATTPPAVKWFAPSRRGLISGIVVSGVGLAAVYMAPLTSYLMAATSIKTTFLILGVSTIGIVGGLSQLLRNPPAGYVPPAGAAAAAKNRRITGIELDWSAMLKTPQFYMLWLMYVLAAAPGLMILSNIASIAKSQADGWEKGFICVMALAIFNTLGRLFSGYVSDLLGRSWTMMLAFALQAVNLYFFRDYTSPELLIFGSAFTGLCYGAIFTLMPAATADFYGMKNLGMNYGILFTGFGVAGVVGSLLGGKVKLLFGNYDRAYLTVAAMLVLSALLATVIRAPKSHGQSRDQ